MKKENKEDKITELEDELSELKFRERNINGLIEQLPNQNQTAIEELEKVKVIFSNPPDLLPLRN